VKAVTRIRLRVSALIPVGCLFVAFASIAEPIEPNQVYDSSCGLCHQKGGVGIPGQFPRLAGRAHEIAVTDEGRRYLIETVVFGIAGKVVIDGVPIFGVMPAFPVLSDSDVASVLTYVTQLGADQPGPAAITAEEVKSVREGGARTPGQVRARRDAVLPP
jgi:mono/diheme cytochrome c family protein